MSEQIQPIRGMNDILPTEIGAWQYLERTVREIVTSYGYEEMRVPIVHALNCGHQQVRRAGAEWRYRSYLIALKSFAFWRHAGCARVAH